MVLLLLLLQMRGMKWNPLQEQYPDKNKGGGGESRTQTKEEEEVPKLSTAQDFQPARSF